MHITREKFTHIRSAFALVLAASIIFGSVFTVAAAVQTTDDSFAQTLNNQASDATAEIEMLNGDVAVANLDGTGITTNLIKAGKVTLDYYGNIQTINIAKGTVADVLAKANVNLKENQVVEPFLSTEIKDGMTVYVYDGKKISVKADGKTNTEYVPKGKVYDVLNSLGYQLDKDDILSVDKNSQIWNVDSVTVKRVDFGEETVTELIAYGTSSETSDKINLGETKIGTKGVSGKKLVTRKCKYIDGKKDSEEVIDSKTIKEPVDEVVLVGTKGASKNGGAGSFTDMYGNTIAYSRVHTGSGTAYTAPAGAGTATGVPAYHGGVAVNPNIIPYGSKLYITSTDGSFVYGYATAVDTGGALMDGSAIVDCFYNTYDECVNFGRRDVNVYVLS